MGGDPKTTGPALSAAPTSPGPALAEAYAERLGQCLLHDRLRLTRRLRELSRRSRIPPRALARIEAAMEDSIGVRAQRACARASVRYPPDLPISERREEIAALIREHQVVIVCGETGSGKSTQLPKICLELGRGVDGMIGHTQPRRIAARSVATRIASELSQPLGTTVGYRVRFTDRVSASTSVKLMTDGVLLAEIPYDRRLTHYDTLIIDEAHERSLNIDFLLGYLPRVLAERPDLKLIVTSATIDPGSFARHFGNAPVIEVSGRVYPVDLRYRPLPERDSEDDDRRAPAMIRAVADTVEECTRQGPGDVLVFLPGEREIRDAAHAIGRRVQRELDILPLYARLSPREQDRVFAAHSTRRVVLATNVAETSLTVPGIRFVIDSGLARISRYTPGRKIQRLPIEPIARDAAEQRRGRAGRTASGTCIRLYDEADFDQRPAYTEPEVLRASLAAVILRMHDLGLGAPERFAFLDPPSPRQIRDGQQQLRELGALDGDGRLTETGRRLARLPIDPRLGRILLEGAATGCLRETLVVTAALAIPDPRIAPAESREAAREAHRAFHVPESDFLSLLKLWESYQTEREGLSKRALRRWCEAHFLSFLRMLEWSEVHRQLLAIASELKLTRNTTPAAPEALHRALLAGLLGNIARRDDDGSYRGARGRRLTLFPGSGVQKKSPRWLVAAEVIETSRLYAHTVGPVRPEWIEQAAGDQVRRQWLEPSWDPDSGRVLVYEQVSLYGLVLIPRRSTDFGRIDPAAAREIFIREALAADGGGINAPFLEHNRALLARIDALEQRSRRRDLAPSEHVLHTLYDAALAETVHDRRSLEHWLKCCGEHERAALTFGIEALIQREPADAGPEQYPDHLTVNGVDFDLDYRFAPGEDDDGVTVHVPLRVLGHLAPAAFTWLVPGLLEEKACALLRALPRDTRRRLVPVPDTVRACMPALLERRDRALSVALSEALREQRGIRINAETFDESGLPAHLRMRFRIIDDDGCVVAEGADLNVLQRRLGQRAADAFAHTPTTVESPDAMTRWTLDTLPETVAIDTPQGTLTAWTALVDRGKDVTVEPRPTAAAATAESREGLRRLLLLELPQHARHLARGLPGINRLCTLFATVGDCDSLRLDLARAITDRAFELDAPLPRNRDAFEQRRAAAASALPGCAADVCALCERILDAHHNARLAHASLGQVHAEAARDMGEQLDALVYPGFVSATPAVWLSELPRYLRAVSTRIERLRAHPARDNDRANMLAPVLTRWRELHQNNHSDTDTLGELRWLLEELRVSLFAQELGTRVRVSPTRLLRRMESL